MRVLFVFSTGRLDSSAAAVWLNLLEGLPARGVEPCVVMPQQPDERLAAGLAARGVRWKRVPFTWWVTSGSRADSVPDRMRRRWAKTTNYRAEQEIGKIIDDHGIELLYICDGTVTAGLEAAKKRGVPVVWHIYEFIRERMDGTDYLDPEMHVGSTLMKADAIITATKSIRTDLVQRFPGLRDKGVKTIYNGVLESCVCDKRDLFEGKRVTFTIVGRVNENKGQEEALRAFVAIARKASGARLRIMGPGDDFIIGRLKFIAEKSGLADQVEFRPVIERIAETWCDTDVVLNCSYSEGCSMPLAEAMVSGCLLLCSTAESNVELVGGKYGLLYERRRPEALADKMRWVLSHEDEARELAAAGKGRGRRLFSLEHQLDAVYQVFLDVAK